MIIHSTAAVPATFPRCLDTKTDHHKTVKEQARTNKCWRNTWAKYGRKRCRIMLLWKCVPDCQCVIHFLKFWKLPQLSRTWADVTTKVWRLTLVFNCNLYSSYQLDFFYSHRIFQPFQLSVPSLCTLPTTAAQLVWRPTALYTRSRVWVPAPVTTAVRWAWNARTLAYFSLVALRKRWYSKFMQTLSQRRLS